MEVDQAGAGDTSCVHSRPVRRDVKHRRIAPTPRSIGVSVQDDWGWSNPRDPSWCPRHPLFRRAARCSPSAGLLVGGPARVSSSHTWEARMWFAIAGAQGTGACSRLSPSCPGSSRRQGSHLPYTSVGPAPLAASPAQPVSESVLAGLTVSNWAWEARHPRPYIVNGVRLDTLGHSDATSSVHRNGGQRTRWTLRSRERKQEGEMPKKERHPSAPFQPCCCAWEPQSSFSTCPCHTTTESV